MQKRNIFGPSKNPTPNTISIFYLGIFCGLYIQVPCILTQGGWLSEAEYRTFNAAATNVPFTEFSEKERRD
jgi:hypothetical protein